LHMQSHFHPYYWISFIWEISTIHVVFIHELHYHNLCSFIHMCDCDGVHSIWVKYFIHVIQFICHQFHPSMSI
jgi:hypothetical protein